MRFPIWSNATSVAPSSSAVNYHSIPFSALSAAWSTSSIRAYIPMRCQISLFQFDLVTAPGVGKSWTFTLQKNGVDTALSITISGNDTRGYTTTESVVFEADDYITLKSTPSGTPAAPTRLCCSVIVDTLGRPEYFYMKSYGIANTGAPSVALPHICGQTWSTTTTSLNTKLGMAHNATITGITVRLSSAPGAGKQFIISILKNDSEEVSSRVTLADSTVYGEITNLSISVTKGDRIQLLATPSGTPAGVYEYVGLILRPEIDGESSTCSISTNLSSGNQWNRPVCSLSSTNTAAEDNTRHINPYNVTYYMKGLYCVSQVAPGAGKSYTFTITKDGVDTELTATLANTAVVAEDQTHVVAFNGENIALKSTSSGTPTATSGIRFSTIIYIPPSTLEGN